MIEKRFESYCCLQQTRRLQNRYRAIAAIPPIVGALFVRNLGTITDYSGLSGLAIAFCFPPLLFLSSRQQAGSMGIPTRTQYDHWGSSESFAKGMLAFGMISIIYCFLLLVLNS